LRDFGAVLGVADLAFRLLPLGVKIKVGVNAMADTFNKTSDQIVRIEEVPDRFYYHIDRCPVCWGRTADVPICHAGLGLLQEGLHWVTGGKNIWVEETHCIAKGDPACTYVIDKRPLD
jgi:predicted hydrocarbon binding protein